MSIIYTVYVCVSHIYRHIYIMIYIVYICLCLCFLLCCGCASVCELLHIWYYRICLVVGYFQDIIADLIWSRSRHQYRCSGPAQAAKNVVIRCRCFKCHKYNTKLTTVVRRVGRRTVAPRKVQRIVGNRHRRQILVVAQLRERSLRAGRVAATLEVRPRQLAAQLV